MVYATFKYVLASFTLMQIILIRWSVLYLCIYMCVLLLGYMFQRAAR